MQMLRPGLGAVLVLLASATATPPIVHAGAPGAGAHARVVPAVDRAGALAAEVAAPEPGVPESGADLIGQPAPRWSFTRWAGSAPLSLKELRGKVVLLRWWTEDCHYCAATLPGIEALRAAHAGEGLVVIGAFHPKPPREVSDRHILAVASRLGFAGPIAVDRDWSTLDRYWLDGHPERSWTSVSFLIDRAGIIRWVHGGGEYHPSSDPRHRQCDLEYRGLERALSAALAPPAAARPTP